VLGCRTDVRCLLVWPVAYPANGCGHNRNDGHRAGILSIGVQFVQRTSDAREAGFAHMGVDLGRAAATVAEQFLDEPHIGACLEQVRGE